MGCDIHLYKEKFDGVNWVAADKWVPYDYGDDDKGIEVPFRERFTDRDYDLFGLLSRGVRREHSFSWESRGIPFDCCREIKQCADSWGSDGHSHSYLFLHELKSMIYFLERESINISGMISSHRIAQLKESISSGNPDWNLLYPYYGWTNQAGYEEFSIDVPAIFIVGQSLSKIVDSFNGVDGENHRIVFFFDN